MPFQRISPEQAKALLDKGGVDLVDVRDPHEWQAGHLPDARHVPLKTLLADPRSHVTKDNVIFVCAHGVRSQTAAQAAHGIGMKTVYSIDGGTVGWARIGLPIVR